MELVIAVLAVMVVLIGGLIGALCAVINHYQRREEQLLGRLLARDEREFHAMQMERLQATAATVPVRRNGAMPVRHEDPAVIAEEEVIGTVQPGGIDDRQ